MSECTLNFWPNIKHAQPNRSRAKNPKPLFLLFHGGSGLYKEEIKTTVESGVVKMSVDTDTQWAYLSGIRDFIQSKSVYGLDIPRDLISPSGNVPPVATFPDLWTSMAKMGRTQVATGHT